MAAIAHVRKTAAWHTIIKWQLYHSAAWVEVKRAAIFSDNGDGTSSWKDVYVKSGFTPTPPPTPTPTPSPPVGLTLSVSATPPTISAVVVTAGLATTNTTEVKVSNGVPPYTYQFSLGTFTSPTAPTIHVVTNSKAYLTYLFTGVPPLTYTAALKCAVRDSAGNVGTVTINATYILTKRH
jgi:hypothetical protein